MPGNNRYLLTLRDGLLATVAAVLGMLVAPLVWQQPGGSIRHVLLNLASIEQTGWALLLGVVVGPATLLGALAGFAVRSRLRSGTLAVAAAVVAAFGISAAGHYGLVLCVLYLYGL